MSLRHLIRIADLSDGDILNILQQAEKMAARPLDFADVARGKLASLVFAEPSTRTLQSFSAAMQKLGGGILDFKPDGQSSLSKGETWEDTLRVLGGYADVMVMRAPDVGLLETARDYAGIPVINAGDGMGEHPTQTLVDLFTIQQKFGRLDVKVALYGDLKHGRTVHSLIQALGRFGAEFVCVAPDELQMPKDYLKGVNATTETDVTKVVADVDVLYVTRLQKERLPEGFDASGYPPVTMDLVKEMKHESLILHPLPRVDEIAAAVDADARAGYFMQAKNGVVVRMAILAQFLAV